MDFIEAIILLRGPANSIFTIKLAPVEMTVAKDTPVAPFSTLLIASGDSYRGMYLPTETSGTLVKLSVL